jgi:hypothetical protein
LANNSGFSGYPRSVAFRNTPRLAQISRIVGFKLRHGLRKMRCGKFFVRKTFSNPTSLKLQEEMFSRLDVIFSIKDNNY